MTRKTFAVNLLLSVASVLALVGGIEIVTRWIDPKTPLLMLPTRENCLRRSPSLSLEFQPHCSGNLAGTDHSTNGLGMRGPEVRDDGSLRILTLGDSCTWGWRVGQDESYPAVLQQLLDARPDGKRYQVLNGGVPGYTSYQGIVALREKGVPLAPAVVIVAFGFNDANERGDVEQQIAFERRFLPFMRVDDLLLQKSTFYRWVRWRSAVPQDEMNSGASPSPKPVANKGKSPGPRVSLEKYVANFEAIIVTARDHGAQPMLLSFWPEGGGRGGRRMAVRIVADKWDVPLVTYDGPRIDIVHPTVEGYRHLAAQIVEALESKAILQ